MPRRRSRRQKRNSIEISKEEDVPEETEIQVSEDVSRTTKKAKSIDNGDKENILTCDDSTQEVENNAKRANEEVVAMTSRVREMEKEEGDATRSEVTVLTHKLELVERKYRELKEVRETIQEIALKSASKKLEKLESLHQKMKSRYEEELRTTQTSLTKALRDLKRCKQREGPINAAASSNTSEEKKQHANEVKGSSNSSSSQFIFQTLTGLQIVPDPAAPEKLHCTAICRPKKRGVKFVVSLPKDGESKCQFIPRANCHLLPAHLREALEIDVADAPSAVAEVVSSLWAQ